jgi:hypothetical protein
MADSGSAGVWRDPLGSFAKLPLVAAGSTRQTLRLEKEILDELVLACVLPPQRLWLMLGYGCADHEDSVPSNGLWCEIWK